MHELGLRAKAAARVLAGTSTEAKDAGLHAAADLLVERVDELLDANQTDVARAEDVDCVADDRRSAAAHPGTRRSDGGGPPEGRRSARPGR